MTGWTLAQLAGGAARPRTAEHSARLIGAADHALVLAGVDRHRCDVPEYDRWVRPLRAERGAERLGQLRTDSGSVALDDAVALALTEAPTSDATLVDSSGLV
jgi:hypothetical protein